MTTDNQKDDVRDGDVGGMVADARRGRGKCPVTGHADTSPLLPTQDAARLTSTGSASARSALSFTLQNKCSLFVAGCRGVVKCSTDAPGMQRVATD